MDKRNLAALRTALRAPLGPHLDDETLAEMATAEAAGEALDGRFAAGVLHLEHCLSCAGSYGDLLALLATAGEEMARQAEAVTPQAVYAALLLEALEAETGPSPELAEVAAEVAAALPAVYTRPLRASDDVGEETVVAALGRRPAAWSPALIAPLVRALRRTQAALSYYLEQAAAAAWRESITLQLVSGGRTYSLAVVTAAWAVREAPADDGMPGRARRSGPLPAAIRLERLSPLACRVNVRVAGRKGEPLANRRVELRIGPQLMAARTDPQGRASFAPVAIGSLSGLTIHLLDG